MITGTFIAAISVVLLLFASSYLTIMLFAIIYSIGESIYSPRVIDYALAIAPSKKGGIIAAMASIPMILGVIVAGIMGGNLLSELCPSTGERKC